jgi:uncharacterized protein YbjT (DUF2867 family)
MHRAAIAQQQRILVVGASGFVGRALVPALVAQGDRVCAGGRHAPRPPLPPGVEWRACDLLAPATLAPALAGCDAACYLAHSMGAGGARFPELERRSAEAFAAAAAQAGLRRIVYLGGLAPRGRASPHLASRLAVGAILRAGAVPALELRASMIIGAGSASWRIVRDLSLRLPAMILPWWLKSRTSPVALEDVVTALVDAFTVPLPASQSYDLPGPEVLSGEEILRRVAALRGHRIPALAVPFLSPWISALWLRLITRADFALARELVLGLADDLLARNRHYWELTRHPPLIPFDVAATRALAAEPPPRDARALVARAAERLVDLVEPRLETGPTGAAPAPAARR